MGEGSRNWIMTGSNMNWTRNQ